MVTSVFAAQEVTTDLCSRIVVIVRVYVRVNVFVSMCLFQCFL